MSLGGSRAEPQHSYVVFEFRFDLVKIKDGQEHEGGETGVEAAVIENETAMHRCGGGADDGADEACENADLPSVFTGEGAKTRGEGDAVDIALCGKCPRHVHATEGTDDADEHEQKRITHRDGPDGAGVLSICGEGESGKGDADGGAREADTLRQEGEDLGQNKDHVEIGKDAKAVNTHVDEANGHTEFVEEVCAIARAVQELFIAVKAETVEGKAEEDRRGKKKNEKDIHKSAICVGKGIVSGVIDHDGVGCFDAEGAIHKGIDKNTENTDGETCFIHIEATMHGCRAGQERGDDESDGDAEKKRQNDAERGGLRRTEGEFFTDGVTEKEVADERTERCGKKGNVDVITIMSAAQFAVNEDADEWRPHIKKIQTVKAVRNDEHIACKGGGGCLHAADLDDDIASKTADGGVEKGAAESAEGEIVCDELGRRGQNACEIAPKCRFFRINNGDGGGDEKGKTDEKCVKRDDLARVFAVMDLRVKGRDVRCVRGFHVFYVL